MGQLVPLHLGLAYMKGDQPHCGFPEKNYAANAERLARVGLDTTLRHVIVQSTHGSIDGSQYGPCNHQSSGTRGGE
jgi:hypothetical protein